MWEGLGLVQILFDFGCALYIPALRSLHANEPFILDDQLQHCGFWKLWLGFLVTLEMVPWKFWTAPPGYSGAAGSSSCGTEFRVMLNPYKQE